MQKQASWEIWATRLLSAATVAALGYFVLFVDFTGQGRLWDRLATRVPALARLAPPVPTDQSPQFAKSGPAVEAAGGADRTLVVAEPAAASPTAQASVAQAPTATTQPAARQMVAPHLTSSLTPFNIDDNSHNRVLSVPNQPQAAAAAAVTAAPAAPAAPVPSAGAANAVIAARAGYGSASRSEMMGQAAGPVYNLKARKK